MSTTLKCNDEFNSRAQSVAFDLIRNWNRSVTRMSRDLGRQPTVDEIVFSLDVARRQLSLLRSVVHPRPTDNELAASELLLDGLARLKERQERLLTMRFGLLGQPPRSLSEIAEVLSSPVDQVKQMEAEALAGLAGAIWPGDKVA